MANSVTIKEVAQRAEVSMGTVSRVLNNRQNVNEELRQRVMEAAAELGYFGLQGNTSQMRSGNQVLREIGFFFYVRNLDTTQAVFDPFWSRIFHGAEIAAQQANIKLTYRWINSLLQAPEQFANRIYEMRLGGILLVGTADEDLIHELQQIGLPMILVDNYVPGEAFDAVLADNFEGAKEAVDFLIGLHHRHIAFIGGPTLPERPFVNTIYTINRRAMGYQAALLEAGIALEPQLFERCNLLPEGAYEACTRLLEQRMPLSAIFCANDQIAIGVLKALREATIRVPEDISVIGFDDIDLVEHLTPALTTVRIPKEAMGALAVKTLIARAADPDAPNVTNSLRVGLVRRDSTGLAPI